MSYEIRMKAGSLTCIVLVAIFAIMIFGGYIGYKVQKIPYNMIYNGNDIDELYEFVGAGRQADSYDRKGCDADYEISVSQEKNRTLIFFSLHPSCML